MKENKKHLPVIGVGPVIVVPQIVLSAAGIFISTKEFLSFARISHLEFRSRFWELFLLFWDCIFGVMRISRRKSKVI